MQMRTIRFKLDRLEITYIVAMFCATFKLPVETLKNLFIAPATMKFIQPFLKIVGYQGDADKLIIADFMEIFNFIPKRREEDYHSIKDDILLVSVYTTENVTIRGMLILDDFITDDIRTIEEYKDYVKVFVGIKQSSTFILPPSDDRERDETTEATLLSLTMHKTALATEAQENVAKDRAGSHKENPKVIDDDTVDDKVEEKKDDEKDDEKNDDDDNDDHINHTLVKEQEKMKEMSDTLNNLVSELTVEKTNELIKKEVSRTINDAIKKDKEIATSNVLELIS
nr:hypothetical protein [Tanacetum cinerariifolium]